MSRQKQKGTSFERLIADYLAAKLNKPIDRAPLHGVNDKGDISGLFLDGLPVVVECKNTAAAKIGEQFAEMEKEKQNAGAAIGVLIKKRRGHGHAGKQYALLSVDDFIKLLEMSGGL